MRTLVLAVMATITALIAAPAAEARRIDGEHVIRLHPVTDYSKPAHKYKKARYSSRKQYKKSRHSSNKRYKKGRVSKTYSSKRRHASRKGSGRRKLVSIVGSGGASRSCLTGQARALLSRIEGRFGKVQIISTCRPGARIATTGKISKHATGQAIDFRAPGKKRQVVQWLIANHKSGGTMTYSDMDHIHVDVGYHFVALNRPSGRS